MKDDTSHIIELVINNLDMMVGSMTGCKEEKKINRMLFFYFQLLDFYKGYRVTLLLAFAHNVIYPSLRLSTRH